MMGRQGRGCAGDRGHFWRTAVWEDATVFVLRPLGVYVLTWPCIPLQRVFFALYFLHTTTADFLIEISVSYIKGKLQYFFLACMYTHVYMCTSRLTVYVQTECLPLP